MKLFRGQPDNWVWKPTLREVGRINVGFAFIFYVFAVCEFYSPMSPSRRWAWLESLALDVFGPDGKLILLVLIGTALLINGIRKYIAARRL